MDTVLQTLNRASQVWLSWMWPMTWQVVLMGLAVLGVALLARKASPRFRYYLWCLLLFKLCLPPSLSFVTGVGRWVLPERAAVVPVAVSRWEAATPLPDRSVAVPPPGTELEFTPVGPVSQDPTSPTVRAARAALHISWAEFLCGTWCLGVAALVVLFLKQHRRMRSLLAAARPVDDERVLRLLSEAKTELGVSSRVTLLSVEKLGSPLLFGVFRPRIAIPRQALESLPLDQVRPILLHELGHLRRKDLWLSYLQLVVQVLYWFHPVVWLANIQLRREREMIVDDMVLSKLQGRRESYSASLVGVVKQGALRRLVTPAYVGIVETPGALARRLGRILDVKRELSLRLGWVGLVMLVVLGLALIPQARSQGRKDAPAPPKTPGAEVKSTTAEPFRVRGEVLRPDSRPLEGARLLLYHNKSRWGMGNAVVQETSTGKDGTFEFKDPVTFDRIVPHSYAQDRYVLLAIHPDYAFGWANVLQGSVQESYRIQLTAPQTRTVTVTDLAGKPLPAARVRVSNAGDREAAEAQFRSGLRLPTEIAPLTVVTDTRGQAAFKNLPDTRCYFVATLTGYASNFGVTGSRIRLSPGAQVVGKAVVNAQDGRGRAVIHQRADPLLVVRAIHHAKVAGLDETGHQLAAGHAVVEIMNSCRDVFDVRANRISEHEELHDGH